MGPVMTGQWSVVVGNIGTVYTGSSELQARDDFASYVHHSRDGYGRVAGEPVTLLHGGEIIAEHIGDAEDAC